MSNLITNIFMEVDDYNEIHKQVREFIQENKTKLSFNEMEILRVAASRFIDFKFSEIEQLYWQSVDRETLKPHDKAAEDLIAVLVELYAIAPSEGFIIDNYPMPDGVASSLRIKAAVDSKEVTEEMIADTKVDNARMKRVSEDKRRAALKMDFGVPSTSQVE